MSKCIPHRRYATHAFDKYPAKMVPHIARFAIEQCTEIGQHIFDPFCGCGTTIIESRLLGRSATGVEINPYATILAKSKSFYYSTSTIMRYCNIVLEAARHIKVDSRPFSPEWISYWFYEQVLQEVYQIREAIRILQPEIPPKYYTALLAMLAITARNVSKADDRSPKPFISKRCLQKEKGKNANALQVFLEVCNRFVCMHKEFRKLAGNNKTKVTISCRDARQLTKKLLANRYDAIITSPPYLTAQDYYRSSKIELAITQIIDQKQAIKMSHRMVGTDRGSFVKRTIPNNHYKYTGIHELEKINHRAAMIASKYIEDMNIIIQTCQKILKPTGRLCLVVGNSMVRSIQLPIHKWLIQISQDNGFHLFKHFIEEVRNRRVPPNRQGHRSIISNEHVLFFAKK